MLVIVSSALVPSIDVVVQCTNETWKRSHAVEHRVQHQEMSLTEGARDHLLFDVNDTRACAALFSACDGNPGMIHGDVPIQRWRH